MHCPSCGTIATQPQKFCRACGFKLEKVVQLLEEATATGCEPEWIGEMVARQQRLEKWRDLAFHFFSGSVGLGLLTLLGYGVIYQVMIVKGDLWNGTIILLLVLTVIIGLALVVLNAQAEELKAKLEQNRVKQTLRPAEESASQPVEGLTQAVTTSKLLAESRGEPVGSIIEEPTKTLQPR